MITAKCNTDIPVHISTIILSMLGEKYRLAWALVLASAHVRTFSAYIIIIIITRVSCHRRQGASADKLQLKAATILPLVELARSKQDPINRGHGAQYLYRPPPAGANIYCSCSHCQGDSMHIWRPNKMY